jgi:integrase
VQFKITNNLTGESKRLQFRGGINYFHDAKERTKAGLDLVVKCKKQLESGWNPWGLTDEDPDSPEDAMQNLTFVKALQFSLDKYKASKDTIKAYRTTVNYLTRAAQHLQLDKIKAVDCERKHIKLLLEFCTTKHRFKDAPAPWTNGNRNKNLGFLHALCESLIEWEILKYNPAHKIKPLPVAETEKFVPLTDKEKKDLYDFFIIHHYRFFTYLMVLYHTGIRPKEILALKIKDINLQKPEIKIVPDLAEENSKVKKIREIPICNELLPFLREMQLSSYPSEYYVFGSPKESGRGNRGGGSADGHLSGASQPEYFSPNPTRIKRDTATKLWKKIVWEKLGIEKYQYAMKRTGGDDKILAGMELDELQQLYGHGSKFMTMKYAKKVKDVYRKRIIEKSPGFLETHT